MKFVAPSHRRSSFTCPHCGVLSQQHWFEVLNHNHTHIEWLSFASCGDCKAHTVWLGNSMIWPAGSSVPNHHPDTPEVVATIYDEAQSVYPYSPRASAALLRLGLQMLIQNLSPGAKDINKGIAELVKSGMPQRVQQAMDVLRVVGNNAVHPGQIDLDDKATTASLFDLINLVVDTTISEPKKIESLFASLPASAREQIEKRDGKEAKVDNPPPMTEGSHPSQE